MKWSATNQWRTPERISWFCKEEIPCAFLTRQPRINITRQYQPQPPSPVLIILGTDHIHTWPGGGFRWFMDQSSCENITFPRTAYVVGKNPIVVEKG